ncbi:nicotinate-nicotinamide nucleotide adenylyltransferase [Bdellovibrionota bacterium FG-2]
MRTFFRTFVIIGLILSSASWATTRPDASCLLKHFLKSLLAEVETDFDTLSDLGGTLPSFGELLGRATPTLGATQRYGLLRDFPIRSIIAAPGHRFLRKPAQIEGLVKYIRTSNGGDFSHDKILLNLVTDSDGTITSVDLWNAHHRLLAYLEANYRRLGDIPEKNIEILVNGKTTEGEAWNHFLSIGGVETDSAGPYSVVPEGGDIRTGTIAVSGALSNHQLGSRNSLGQLHRTITTRKVPKIGVYFGTFDPIHEGHFQVAMSTIKELGLDELVIVPNGNPIHKPGATSLKDRIRMLTLRTQHEPKINVYVGDSREIINQFGRDPFIERLAQSYGTHDIYQIIGEDSFNNLLEQGKLSPSLNRNLVVFPRDSTGEGPSIPAELAGKVTVARTKVVSKLSSAAIRSKLGSGVAPKPEELHPEVLRDIKEHGLYQP